MKKNPLYSQTYKRKILLKELSTLQLLKYICEKEREREAILSSEKKGDRKEKTLTLF